MLFTWDTTNLCVVFRWWHVRGPWSLLLTLLGVIGLGMSYEALRHLARKYDETSLGNIRLASPVSDDDNNGRRSPATTGKYQEPYCDSC
jgi:solute carrier family 31 (copper transporter), member 1